MSKNIVELAANVEVDGTKAFEATFPPTDVHELLLEFDPKHRGPPICVLSDGGANTKEIHVPPLAGREGRYSAQVGGMRFSSVRVTTARNVKARLLKVKLMGGHADHPGGGSAPSAPSKPTGPTPSGAPKA